MTTPFRYAHAAGDDWRTIAKDCLSQLGSGPPSELGFVYMSDLLAAHAEDITAWLREKTGVPHWVGSTGIGICATGREYLDEPAMVVMLADFAPGSFQVFSGIRTADDLKIRKFNCGERAANFAVVHADPANSSVPALIAGIAAKLESGFIVGGLSSSRAENLQIAEKTHEGGVSGVLLSDDITVATRLTQGCSPLGPRHRITEAQRNIVLKLDGRPAFEVLKDDLGEKRSRDLQRLGNAVFAGLPVAGSDTGDYLVRNLVGIDPSRGLVAIGDAAEEGGELLFCRRDSASAVEDMRRMLASIKEGLYTKPRGALYFSCLGRGANLFGPESEELKLIQAELGDLPLAGFFCNGEISHNRLYGYTGVLTLFA
jgi:small ligand-binding sensory domain FIST